MSFLSRLSLANRSVIALITVAIILIGAYIIPTLKQELTPSLFLPSISVVTPYPGASPGQVEQDVTNPLEQNFQGLPGVQQVTSQSSEGLSIIQISYSFGTDLDKAQQKLTEQSAKANLPANSTPQIQALNTDNFPIITLSVSSALNQQDLAIALKKTVVPAIQGIDGVGTVNVTGIRQQLVTVNLDLQKMQTNGVTIEAIQSALQADNVKLPAGEVSSNGQVLAIRAGNTLHSLQQIQDLIVGTHTSAQTTAGAPQTAIPTVAGTPSSSGPPVSKSVLVKLSDVATIKEDLTPSSTITRVNGKLSLGIDLTKTESGNTVSISQALHSKLPDLEKNIGHATHFTVVSDQTPYIQSSISDLVREGLLGAGFAVLVILIFLLSLRSTLVTAISIPLSILIALIALWMQNYSLNILTLSGLTIAIGRVVDDSIVVLENIYRHLHTGESKHDATINGVKEVAGAVTSSTLTTVAVFLPLIFIGGLVGEYTHPLALTVTIALLASLFVALTIIPVLAFWFLKTPKNVRLAEPAIEKPNITERGYVPMISWVTKHRAITVVGAILLLIGSFMLFPLLPSNAFGNQGSSSFDFSEQFPGNTSLAHTDQGAQQIENVLSKISDIQSYEAVVGTSNAGTTTANATNQASFTINVKPGVDADTTQATVRNRLKSISNIGTITFQNQGSNTSSVTVQASDDATLRQAAQQVKNAVSQTASTSDVKSDLTNAIPLLDVTVDPAKAILHGMTPIQVAQLLQMIYTGTTATHVVLDNTNNTQQNIEIKVDSSANTIQQLQDMQIPGPLGSVRLGNLATVTRVSGPVSISHFNDVRTATITYSANGQNVQGIINTVQSNVAKLHLPSGATISAGSSLANGQDTLNQLYLALLFAIPLVFIVMVATFRSLIQPLILLVAIPFAAMGSITLAVITRTAIGVSSLFGALMLIGIVVTNAIVLIDRINHYRATGMSARDAVIAGGRQRVRPILMTALATIMALIPTALGIGGAGNVVVSPDLAIVVIGGLTSSTFLTLLFVPTLYVIFENTKDRFHKQTIVVTPERTEKEFALS